MSRNRYLPQSHPWQSDLVSLCRQRPRLSDAAVARELTRRHHPLTFTRRMVWHHRVELVEKQGGRLGEDCKTLTQSEHNARRAYQLQAGLGDLLPDYVEPVAGRWVTITTAAGRELWVWAPRQHGGFGAGHELTRREADVLALLLAADRPLSRREIARLRGVHWTACYSLGWRCPIDRLAERGLIELLPGGVYRAVRNNAG